LIRLNPDPLGLDCGHCGTTVSLDLSPRAAALAEHRLLIVNQPRHALPGHVDGPCRHGHDVRSGRLRDYVAVSTSKLAHVGERRWPAVEYGGIGVGESHFLGPHARPLQAVRFRKATACSAIHNLIANDGADDPLAVRPLAASRASL